MMSKLNSQFDMTALKEQFKILKNRRNEIMLEKMNLENEINEIEAKESKLKQDLIKAEADNELRIAEIIMKTNDKRDCDVKFDKRFIEMNRKLEVKLLVEEIREALPSLETKALEWESRINAYEKKATQKLEMKDKVPDSFVTSLPTLEKKYQDLMDEHIKLKASFKIDFENKNRERVALVKKVRKIRNALEAGIDDVQTMQYSKIKAKLHYYEMDSTLRVLLHHYNELRLEFEDYHAGRGWQTEAFKKALKLTNKSNSLQKSSDFSAFDGEVKLDSAASALKLWLPPIINSDFLDHTPSGDDISLLFSPSQSIDHSTILNADLDEPDVKVSMADAAEKISPRSSRNQTPRTSFASTLQSPRRNDTESNEAQLMKLSYLRRNLSGINISNYFGSKSNSNLNAQQFFDLCEKLANCRASLGDDKHLGHQSR